MLQWICRTPKTTTIRCNLLKNSSENVCTEITKYWNDRNILPKIEINNQIPELITIKNLNTKMNLSPNLDIQKEIIVDVSCGASILRGAHLYGPGVLAMPSNTSVGECVNIYADFDKKCKKGTNILYDSNYKIFIGIGVTEMQRFQLFGANIDPRYIEISI